MKLKRPSRYLLGILLWLLIALPFVLAIRSSVVQSFSIPSGSMIPTIRIGDHVLVWKGAYRWKFPFSEYLSEPVILKEKAGPERGDIVVFRYPQDLTIFYIKRVIGVSGDWIAIRNRKLYINDNEVKSAPISADPDQITALKDAETEGLKDYVLLEEEIDGRKHLILHDRNQFLSERYGPVAIPPGHVFVMGDNRDFSNDSRFWGFVPVSLVEGRALRVWLNLQLATDPFHFRFSPGRLSQRL